MTAETDDRESVRIFIGSSARNIIEEKVFCYTLEKYARSPLDIYIIDGQKGTAKSLRTGDLKTLPEAAISKIPGATAFSLARWAIPQWCDYRGKAIYCDSDQLALADITELWNFELGGSVCAAVPVKQAECYQHYVGKVLRHFLKSPEEHYLASVMLFDCEKASVWSLESLIESIDAKAFSLTDLMFLSPPFRRALAVDVEALPSEWNHLDIVNSASKIVHFTDLTSQPWKYHHHAISDFWEENFLAALDSGAVSAETVAAAQQAGYISARIKSLAALPAGVRSPINRSWRFLSAARHLSVRTVGEGLQMLLQPARKLRSRVKRLTNAHP